MAQRPGDVQVPGDFYAFDAYDHVGRWMSYWYQVRAVVRSGARSVLEIGCGSGLLRWYLERRAGLSVTTLDHNPELNPDLVGDVRDLHRHVPEAGYDAVVAFQVLEHLPFECFSEVVRQLGAASRGWVILSLPHSGKSLQLRARIGSRTFAWGRQVLYGRPWSCDGQHYWEVGTSQVTLQGVLRELSRLVRVERHYPCADYPYHHFFECSV